MGIYCIFKTGIKRFFKITIISEIYQFLWEIRNLLFHIKKEQVYREKVLNYEKFWRENFNMELSKEKARCFEEASKLIQNNSKVLELGCGNGMFLFFLKRKKKIKELGIDISQIAIEAAKRKGINVMKFDAARGDFMKLTGYNYIVMLDFLEHIVNGEEVLLRLKDLNPEAVIIVSIPNAGYYFNRFRLFFGGRFIFQLYHPAWHVRFWTIKDFVNMAKNLGLVIDKIIPYHGTSIFLLRRVFPNIFAEYVLFKTHFDET